MMLLIAKSHGIIRTVFLKYLFLQYIALDFQEALLCGMCPIFFVNYISLQNITLEVIEVVGFSQYLNLFLN